MMILSNLDCSCVEKCAYRLVGLLVFVLAGCFALSVGAEDKNAAPDNQGGKNLAAVESAGLKKASMPDTAVIELPSIPNANVFAMYESKDGREKLIFHSQSLNSVSNKLQISIKPNPDGMHSYICILSFTGSSSYAPYGSQITAFAVNPKPVLQKAEEKPVFFFKYTTAPDVSADPDMTRLMPGETGLFYRVFADPEWKINVHSLKTPSVIRLEKQLENMKGEYKSGTVSYYDVLNAELLLNNALASSSGNDEKYTKQNILILQKILEQKRIEFNAGVTPLCSIIDDSIRMKCAMAALQNGAEREKTLVEINAEIKKYILLKTEEFKAGTIPFSSILNDSIRMKTAMVDLQNGVEREKTINEINAEIKKYISLKHAEKAVNVTQ